MHIHEEFNHSADQTCVANTAERILVQDDCLPWLQPLTMKILFDCDKQNIRDVLEMQTHQ